MPRRAIQSQGEQARFRYAHNLAIREIEAQAEERYAAIVAFIEEFIADRSSAGTRSPGR